MVGDSHEGSGRKPWVRFHIRPVDPDMAGLKPSCTARGNPHFRQIVDRQIFHRQIVRRKIGGRTSGGRPIGGRKIVGRTIVARKTDGQIGGSSRSWHAAILAAPKPGGLPPCQKLLPFSASTTTPRR